MSMQYVASIPDGMPIAARSAVMQLFKRTGNVPFLISTTHVPRSGVCKTEGGVVEIPSGVCTTDAWLVFLDLCPQVPWGHLCSYYFVDEHGNVSTGHNDEYPPRQETRFVC